MKDNIIKGIVTSISATISATLGVLYIPVLLMVLCNVIDYITGLMAAANREIKINSYKSISGIRKKVAMWLLVVVGAIIDELIQYSVATIGYQWVFQGLVACIVAIWIICNEIISIVENMKDIGIDLPKWLLPLVKNIKKTADEAVNIPEEEEK